MAAHCTVRKLCIRTPDKAYVPRMNFVLEDALRTAAFSGLPANGMVYVRRLELGKCSPSVSSLVLSRKIDDLLRHTRPIIITENAPEQPDASIVWFPDEPSPHRFLIKRLAENARPVSWYWSSAVRGWHPQLTSRESYLLILAQVSKQKAGMQGMAFVLEPLFDTKTLPDVLNALERNEAARLLVNMGHAPAPDFNMVSPSVKKEGGEMERQALREFLSRVPCAQNTLARAVRLWSVFDSRTMLCASLVLARMGRSATPAQVNRLFAALAETQSGVLHIEKTPVPMPAKEAQAALPCQTKPDVRADDYSDGLLPSKRDPFLTSLLALETKDLVCAQDDISKQSFLSEKPIPEKEIRQERHEVNAAPTDVWPAVAEPENPEYTQAPFQPHTLTEWRLPFCGFAGDASDYAGFVFLISLLKRLGIAGLIEANPEYEDLKVAQRILFRCADRLNIPANDPAVCFLGERPEPSRKFVPFAAPSPWQRILYPSPAGNRRFCISRITGAPGHRLILDEKERLVLGVWSPKNRFRVESWLQASDKPLHRAPSQPWTVDRLVDNMVLAMNRYVGLYAGMDLSGLIRRPAWIAATRTHLDVSMPINGLDVRVRMAGLDIDPGWTPWLSKVIQFHYVGGAH